MKVIIWGLPKRIGIFLFTTVHEKFCLRGKHKIIAISFSRTYLYPNRSLYDEAKRKQTQISYYVGATALMNKGLSNMMQTFVHHPHIPQHEG